jgi:hypothetical protein
VQVYRLIKEWTAWDIARRAAFAFFGIFSGTEENPEFIKCKMDLPRHAFLEFLHFLFLKLNILFILAAVEEKLNKNAKIIVACSAGGTMKPTQNLPQGQQSRYSIISLPFMCLFSSLWFFNFACIRCKSIYSPKLVATVYDRTPRYILEGSGAMGERM